MHLFVSWRYCPSKMYCTVDRNRPSSATKSLDRLGTEYELITWFSTYSRLGFFVDCAHRPHFARQGADASPHRPLGSTTPAVFGSFRNGYTNCLRYPFGNRSFPSPIVSGHASPGRW